MKPKYDMHLATEVGDSECLKEALRKLGFSDDNLAQRGLIFDTETAKYYETCPLIDVHVSKKVDTHPELRELELEVDRLMIETGATGYWHSECILADEHLESLEGFALKPLPFERLVSRPRDREKVWDIHLSFREKLMPPGLSEAMIESGIYYLARMKRVAEGGEERFAVYTVQGINRLVEGKRFYAELCAWLKSIGAPPCDIKLELTTAMKLYRNPRAVPPTVDTIAWR